MCHERARCQEMIGSEYVRPVEALHSSTLAANESWTLSANCLNMGRTSGPRGITKTRLHGKSAANPLHRVKTSVAFCRANSRQTCRTRTALNNQDTKRGPGSWSIVPCSPCVCLSRVGKAWLGNCDPRPVSLKTM
jgi:hypothetical protein